MKITRNKDTLIIELPLWQDAYDAIDEKVGQVHAVIGVIWGDEQGLAHAIDMTYKGKAPQVGEFIVKTDYPRDDFIKLCTKLGIEFYEHKE